MKAISLWQPWASAIFAGVKKMETRHWRMPANLIGVTVGIHAAKKTSPELAELWDNEVRRGDPRNYAAFLAQGFERYRDLPLGCIIGCVRFGESQLTDSMYLPEGSIEGRWGDFTTGRFAWPIQEGSVYRFAKEIPCVGRQGFFDWPYESPVLPHPFHPAA